MIDINIFDALNQGKGKLNEENLTAMLAYILNPYSDHGLKDLFLRRFLESISKGTDKDYISLLNKDHAIDITLESPYDFSGGTRRIDIDLKVFCKNEESLRVLIENKVRASSADGNQFRDEYLGVKTNIEDDGLDEVEVVMVFLTPSIKDKRLADEYENLSNDLLGENHRKEWIFWDDGDKPGTITDGIREILLDEHEIRISPISEYVRHTLKAFVRFIKESQVKQVKNGRYSPAEHDNLISECIIPIDDTEYRIEEYLSSAIKVFNKNTEEYVSAKTVLRKVIKQYNMPISLSSESGRNKNTRKLGKEVLNFVDKVMDRALKNDPSSIEIIESNGERL